MKNYLEKNVYDAAIERIAYCFKEFENVLVSFSGGKDSGVMLNLCYQYAREHGLLDKLAMYHLDYEAQYQMTTDYVTDTFEKDFPEIKKYWLCLPVEAQCACRMDGAFWTPWAQEDKKIWVREMPANEYVVNEFNAQFKIERGLTDNQNQDKFCRWFAKIHGPTALMIGIRADESYDRYKLVSSAAKALKIHRYKNLNWTVEAGNICRAYPIYDWAVEDIWIYTAQKGVRYNKLYDLYYKAGMGVNMMRVASPFNNSAGATLKYYKVIDPKNWGRMVGRVNGVNFMGLYGDTTAMGWKSIKKPNHFTWKEYCYFLLDTLPAPIRENYLKKLEVSKKSWIKGGVIENKTIDELKAENAPCEVLKEKSKRTKLDKSVVKFNDYMDDTTCTDFRRIPTYKRMCVCIIKNDWLCKYMGFAMTKAESERRKQAIEKYKCL